MVGGGAKNVRQTYNNDTAAASAEYEAYRYTSLKTVELISKNFISMSDLRRCLKVLLPWSETFVRTPVKSDFY